MKYYLLLLTSLIIFSCSDSDNLDTLNPGGSGVITADIDGESFTFEASAGLISTIDELEIQTLAFTGVTTFSEQLIIIGLTNSVSANLETGTYNDNECQLNASDEVCIEIVYIESVDQSAENSQDGELELIIVTS